MHRGAESGHGSHKTVRCYGSGIAGLADFSGRFWVLIKISADTAFFLCLQGNE